MQYRMPASGLAMRSAKPAKSAIGPMPKWGGPAFVCVIVLEAIIAPST